MTVKARIPANADVNLTDMKTDLTATSIIDKTATDNVELLLKKLTSASVDLTQSKMLMAVTLTLMLAALPV